MLQWRLTREPTLNNTTDSSLVITNLPNDVIVKICCYVELSCVRHIIEFSAGNIELVAAIRKRYLRNNFCYLHKTNCMTGWEKRMENTIAWMQCNEWKKIFYSTDIGAPRNNINELHGEWGSVCLSQDSQMNTIGKDMINMGKECQAEDFNIGKKHKEVIFDNQGSCKPFLDIIGSVERGIVEVTKHLIEVEGFDVNKHVIVDTSHFEMNVNPLNVALKLPKTEMLHYLLQVENINVNCAFQSTFGNTILHYAAGDDKISPSHMAALLSHPQILVDVRDIIGKTPLHYLCWFLPSSCEEKMHLLIQAGADVSATCNGGIDPLKVLVQAGKHRKKNIEVMQDLLKTALTTDNDIGLL